MAKKKVAKKKGSKKKTADTLPQNSGMWFEKNFTEQDGSETIGRKRKLVEAFYAGYLHSYNQNGSSANVYKILTEKNDGFDGFQWSIVNGKQHLEVFIKPTPTPEAPGGGASDPPNPSHPPPKLT